jgi:hypothetical protein
MLALPILMGIAEARPTGWHIVLGLAAVAGYLASATAQGWVRGRERLRLAAPVVTYCAAATGLWLVLAAANPSILPALPVLPSAAFVALAASRLGRARGLVAGLAQVCQAVALVPVSAALSGEFDQSAVARATFVAAVYLIGTVLAVRSVIREQGNTAFAAVSVGFHIAATLAAALFLPAPFVLLLAMLTIRAATLPLVQRRLRGTSRPLRPIKVGMVEMVMATSVVGLAFASHL